MRIDLDRRWRVRLRTAVDLPVAAETAWRQLREFRRFSCVDSFHREMRLHAPLVKSASPLGASFDLVHGFAGLRLIRVGRILRWDEGRGYAFSDLSRRHPLLGFPHVYEYELVPGGERRCRLWIRVVGKWTARRIPRPLVRGWLAVVFLKIRISLVNTLLWRHLAGHRGSLGGGAPAGVQ